MKFKREKIAVAVAAGDSERRAGNLHARPDHVTGINGVAQRDIGIAFCAHVANGGEPGHQRESRVLCAQQRGTCCGDSQTLVSAPAGVGSEMSVDVEKTGEQRGRGFRPAGFDAL